MEINSGISYNQSSYLNGNKALERISSGSKLNSASDDASSLAISAQLQKDSSGYAQSISNVNSGVALTQIADQAINEQSNILDTIKEKLLQASTDTTSDDGRANILKDIQALSEQLNNIASSTNYNGNYLLQENATSKASSANLSFQAGNSSADLIETQGIQANTLGLGLENLLNQDAATFDSSTAREYLETVDSAITTLSSFRSELGSSQNQLESSGRSLISAYTQTQEAQSVLSSANIAEEIANFNKNNVLTQAGIYALAQSNNIKQDAVIRLLS
ncbi:MAG: flagellin [Arcobacter sp.]|nr:MAG: flagellin [Arcobacter sp.]